MLQDGWLHPFSNTMRLKSIEEFRRFSKNGRPYPLESCYENIVCLNPTSFHPNVTDDDLDTTAEMNTLKCVVPYDAYFPVPFDEQLDATQSQFDFESKTALEYCTSRLRFLVSELRSRKHRVAFHFHFGDCIEFCLKNETMKNQFHIIFSYDLADRVVKLTSNLFQHLNKELTFILFIYLTRLD